MVVSEIEIVAAWAIVVVATLAVGVELAVVDAAFVKVDFTELLASAVVMAVAEEASSILPVDCTIVVG